MYNTKLVLLDGTTILPGYLDREKKELTAFAIYIIY
jgi:hypothetical protein